MLQKATFLQRTGGKGSVSTGIESLKELGGKTAFSLGDKAFSFGDVAKVGIPAAMIIQIICRCS
jgi:hypothetical protein